jgi:hypothetical protein
VLRPASVLQPTELRQLITELDHAEFAVREKALRSLEGLGSLARDVLEEEQRRPATLEARRRQQQLLRLARAGRSPPVECRTLRAIEVLEHIGGTAVEPVLRSLAAGAPAARTTRAAKEALDRLMASAGK